MSREVLLGVAPFMQPSPSKNEGGDCFACTLTAALRYLFPDKPISFEDAWGLFVDEKSKRLSNTWYTMRSALWRAHSLGYRMEITHDIVQPKFDADAWSHAWWSFFPDSRYARQLEGWLCAGWVAITEINFSGSGPMTTDGKLHGTNHFVLLDGVRWTEEKGEFGSHMREYIHVVCSVKGAYWAQLQQFLRLYGGAGWRLCRKSDVDEGVLP